MDFLEETEGSLPPPPQDSLPDAGEAMNDFWSMSGNFIYRHHVETRVKFLIAERRIIPYSTGSTLTSPELHTRTWMLCKKAAPMIIGMSVDQEICLILEQVSLSLLHYMRNLQTNICGPVRD